MVVIRCLSLVFMGLVEVPVLSTVHKALHYSLEHIGFDITRIDWKIIILGMVSAPKYLHDHDILHNDIKADNILIGHLHINVLLSILVRVVLQLMEGRTPFQKQRHRYSLEHPQVAPDLRDGHCKQSQFSDVYSVGRVIKQINDKFLQVPFVASLGSLCTKYLCKDRPTTTELHTAMRTTLKK